MDIDVTAVSPELVGDFLDFHDHVAFTDNPERAWCYCACHHDPGRPHHAEGRLPAPLVSRARRRNSQ